MTLEERVLAQRLLVMRRGQELHYVTAECRQFEISRNLSSPNRNGSAGATHLVSVVSSSMPGASRVRNLRARAWSR
jgi:hypothetical protein